MKRAFTPTAKLAKIAVTMTGASALPRFLKVRFIAVSTPSSSDLTVKTMTFEVPMIPATFPLSTKTGATSMSTGTGAPAPVLMNPIWNAGF